MTSFDVGALVRSSQTRIVVTCGSGGVGKTTMAAAMAVAAADAGRTVAVITIDPARRLAQSLGLTELDNTPRRVTLDAPGELWAMMLDTRRTFDEMVSEHTSAERAQQILANPFYRSISSSFSGTQEYMAMEKLGQLADTGRYDVIVVDTPPSRSALDFLDAPQRLTSFLDGRMIRLLAAPSRGVMRIVGVGFTLFAKAVSSVIGGQMLTDAARFVHLFEDMFGGFRARAEATYQLLRRRDSAFVVVATPKADAIREATYFADRLIAEDMPLAGLILNRTHRAHAALAAGAADAGIERMSDLPPSDTATWATAGLRIHQEQLALAAQEARMRARFEGAHPEVPVIPAEALPTDVHDVAGLRTIMDALAAPHTAP